MFIFQLYISKSIVCYILLQVVTNAIKGEKCRVLREKGRKWKNERNWRNIVMDDSRMLEKWYPH